MRPAAHRGAAVADIDNDGRLDLVITALGERPKLLRNVSAPEGRWLLLRLVGRTSNRDGLGTVVRVTLDDGRVLVNHATTSVGFASSGDPRVHLGLGHAHVRQIELLWPSGVRQIIERPEVNTVLTIEETEAVDVNGLDVSLSSLGRRLQDESCQSDHAPPRRLPGSTPSADPVVPGTGPARMDSFQSAPGLRSRRSASDRLQSRRAARGGATDSSGATLRPSATRRGQPVHRLYLLIVESKQSVRAGI